MLHVILMRTAMMTYLEVRLFEAYLMCIVLFVVVSF